MFTHLKNATCALAVAGLTLVGSVAVQAQEVTLRLHQMLPAQAAIPSRGLVPWGNMVEEASGGRIKVEHYPSMQLGGAPPQLYGQVANGVVDLTWTVLGYTPGRFPKAEAFELPFMVTTGEQTSQAFHAYVEKNAMDEFADVKLIAVHTHGPGLIHVRGEAIRTMEDLQGKTLRGPTRIVTRFLEAMGASPVGMPVPAVPENLSKGVIDGAVIPWEVTLPLKISELTDASTGVGGDRGLYTATFVFAMNKDSYDSLPDDLKAVIDAHSGIETAAMLGRAMDEVDVIGRRVTAEAGNTIVELTAEETARWRAKGEEIAAGWVQEMTDRGIDGAALLADAKALLAQYSAD